MDPSFFFFFAKKKKNKTKQSVAEKQFHTANSHVQERQTLRHQNVPALYKIFSIQLMGPG